MDIKRGNEKTNELFKKQQDPMFVQKFDDYIAKPVRAGIIKGLIQIPDILAYPKMEELNEKYQGDTKKIYEAYKEETKNNAWKNNELRKKGIDIIKKNREERTKFLQSGTTTDKGIMLAQNILEGVAQPINWFNPKGFFTGLAWDLFQGFVDTTWEKTEVEGKKIEDLNKTDLVDFATGAMTTVAIHGVTKGITKGISKTLKKRKNIKSDPRTPLEKIKAEVDKHGIGATEPNSVIELAERLETGETVSLERGKNFSQEVDNFFTETTEARLGKLLDEEDALRRSTKDKRSGSTKEQAIFEEKLYKGESVPKGKKGDVNLSKDMSRILKPIKRKVKLNAKQIQGEYLGDLSITHMENGGSGNFYRLGDLNELIVKEQNIDGKMFKKMLRGDIDVPDSLIPYAEKWRATADEYIGFKYQKGLSSKGGNFDIVYNKQTAMSRITEAMNKENPEIPANFKEGFLKRSDNRVFLSTEEVTKLKLGKTAGMYDVPDYVLIEKLRNDINATTHDVEALGGGRVVDYKVKDWTQVATENAPLPEMERYFEIKKAGLDAEKNILDATENIKKIQKKMEKRSGSADGNMRALEKSLLEEKQMLSSSQKALESYRSQDIKEFMNDTEKKSLVWLDGVFDEMNVEADPVNTMNYMYKNVINERSGYNSLRDRLSVHTDSIGTLSKEVDENTRHILFSHRKTLQKVAEDELDGLGSVSADVSLRKFSDMSFTGKTIYNTRNLMMYKFLANLNYMKETASNKGRINSGLIDLGFEKRVGLLESSVEMVRATKNTAKYFKSIKDIELSKIPNIKDRIQAEAYLEKVLDMEIDMRGHNVASKVKTLGETGAIGQTASDVGRVSLANWVTANVMMDELPKMEFDGITSMMKQTLINNGIDTAKKFDAFKQDVLSSGSVLSLLDEVLDRNATSKTKEMFSQFSDILGKELNAFDSDSMQVMAKGSVSSLWVKINSMFRMYGMNALGRVLDKATTYIDEDGFTRMRFIQDGEFAVQRNSFTGLSDWKRNSSRLINSSSTALETATMVYAIRWATGKMTGTSADEQIEVKMESLMSGEYGDVVIDVAKAGLLDNIGLDIAMGGSNVVYSYFDQSGKGLMRSASADRLSTSEKIFYGSMYLSSPNIISRGIDNIKFEKNIPSRIITVSDRTKHLWKYKYKKMAEDEQKRGLLPIERVFKEATDYVSYFSRNPEQTERFGEFEEGTPQEAKIALASGVMELAEYGARNEKLNEILVASETSEEREEELKEYGMDYGTQLNKMDADNQKIMNAVLSYSQIYTPETVLIALNEFNTLSSKEERGIFLENLIPKGQEEEFDKYLDKIFDGKNKKLNEIYDRGYSDDTEGYIEFLHALREEL